MNWGKNKVSGFQLEEVKEKLAHSNLWNIQYFSFSKKCN